ncbi:hypothetical protein [Erwinia sp. 198]|uniref:hypothetical protein n=1 Tax=Erwinia sp. 198 TaxID=2022746 RepID=UPI0018F3A873|nr:hypothetical protein [Erwinia sp. 198]
MEEAGWIGHDVWHARCVKLDDDDINLFVRTGAGIARRSCSGMRLACGIAPVRTVPGAVAYSVVEGRVALAKGR